MQMPISEVESHRVGSGLQKKKKEKKLFTLDYYYTITF